MKYRIQFVAVYWHRRYSKRKYFASWTYSKGISLPFHRKIQTATVPENIRPFMVRRQTKTRTQIILTELYESDVWLTVHRNSVWIRKQLDVTFVLSFISPLQVAQHVSGNHVPIFRSWRIYWNVNLLLFYTWQILYLTMLAIVRMTRCPGTCT